MCTGTWPGFCSLRPVEGGYTHRRGGRAGRGWAILSGLIRPVAYVLLGVAFASRVGLTVLSQLVDVDSILASGREWQRALIRNVQYSSHEIAPRSRLVTPPDRKLHDDGGPRGRAGQRHRPAEPVDAVSQAQKS
jgi:hypothetical protein